MNDFILNLVRFNEEIDFNILIPIVVLYVLAFWLLVSIWVFLDSKLRYRSRKKALLLAVLNQVFGLPFLLLYILARPFVPEELTSIPHSDDEKGGVNVPIVNFIGKEGMVMSLQLKIDSSTLISKDDTPEMTIDVSFDSSDSQKVLIEKEAKLLNDKPAKVKTASIAGKVLSFFRRPKSQVEKVEEDEKKEDDKEVSTEATKAIETKTLSKAKKKRSRKKRK